MSTNNIIKNKEKKVSQQQERVSQDYNVLNTKEYINLSIKNVESAMVAHRQEQSLVERWSPKTSGFEVLTRIPARAPTTSKGVN